MAIQIIVVASIVLTPFVIGIIGGIFSWGRDATHMPLAWRSPVDPVFNEEKKGEKLAMDQVDELLKEASSTTPLVVDYGNSTPTPEMDKGIDDLLKAVLNDGGIEEIKTEGDEGLSLDNQDTDSSKGDSTKDSLHTFSLEKTQEPIVSETKLVENGEDCNEEPRNSPSQGSEELQITDLKNSNVIPFNSSVSPNVQSLNTQEDDRFVEPIDMDFPMDYVPISIPMKDYQAIAKRYGTSIASQVTTTPGNGATGTMDVMIGRLVKNVVGYVLKYGDYHIPLKGKFPVDQEGNVLLVMGQFQSPDQFYVSQSIDPESLINSNLPVFEMIV
ncbi:hypothetical protein [Ammoniphilus resinae]|uniref:Uncharacterized protein n=1 Tax=Ammoniphilus resinae TaxID=861532 RepID=A0ABS4GQ93_9BACL|nr:hypothetical protein [Ammoniphilus resinae]MBP1932035.1 hypothetical protein [Ammoniphilus resinae]